MDSILTGPFHKLSQIDPGACVLFRIAQAVHIGIVVMDSTQQKYICDLECDEDGPRYFQHYNGSNFMNDDLLVLTTARIVPDLSAASVGRGHHVKDERSVALYLTADGPVIYSGERTQVFKVSLATGLIYTGEISSAIHAKSWRIEVSAGSDEYDVLRDFGG